MPSTDLHGDPDLIARIHDWLLALWTSPEAAAQFAQDPAASLASHNLSQDALTGVDLRHVAGDVAAAPGLPAGGQNVLTSFANSPASPAEAGPSEVRDVYHVTREVYHDQPIIEKIFQDNSVHVDNSQTFVNNGIIDGNISLDNNSATAIGAGAVAGAGGSTINAATGAGSVANSGSGSVSQASGHGQVIAGSDVGQNSVGSPGSAQLGGGQQPPVLAFGDGHGPVGPGQPGAPQGAPGTDQPGTNQPGTDQPGTDHLRSGHLGTGQLGTDPLGTGHLGTDPLGTGHLGTDPLGTGHLGTDLGTDHLGADHLAADGLPQTDHLADATAHLQPLQPVTDDTHDVNHLDPSFHA